MPLHRRASLIRSAQRGSPWSAGARSRASSSHGPERRAPGLRPRGARRSLGARAGRRRRGRPRDPAISRSRARVRCPSTSDASRARDHGRPPSDPEVCAATRCTGVVESPGQPNWRSRRVRKDAARVSPPRPDSAVLPRATSTVFFDSDRSRAPTPRLGEILQATGAAGRPQPRGRRSRAPAGSAASALVSARPERGRLRSGAHEGMLDDLARGNGQQCPLPRR